MTAEMIQIVVREPGGADMLEVRTGPVPVPADDEVLIAVEAAGVNRPDIVQREGRYPPPPGASPHLGLEVAGTVAAIGGGVTAWRVGDRVCALTNGGGYAGRCVAPAAQCLPIPAGYSAAEAAALPETMFTVYSNVFGATRGRLQPGETLLVHAGASGIGTTAIQLATALGATVLATAGSDEKCAACVRLGAREAFNYRSEDVFKAVKAATDGKGVDVILDIIGGATVQKNVNSLAREGRLVFLAFMDGSKVELDLMMLMLKRLTITGSTLRAQSAAQKAAIAAGLRERVWPLLEAGRCRPVVHATFPIAEVRQAHELMESGRHIGKIVLTLEG